jgi:hypothetical protein
VPNPRCQPAKQLARSHKPVSACPRHSWSSSLTAYRFLYRLYLAQDANFWLSNRAGKGDPHDPPLQPGSAYMIDPALVNNYVKDFIDQKEVCDQPPTTTPTLILFLQIPTCAGFMAILLSNIKLSRGLLTTGVGALGCRHELWQPQCVVNLQKGERYGDPLPAPLSRADPH